MARSTARSASDGHGSRLAPRGNAKIEAQLTPKFLHGGKGFELAQFASRQPIGGHHHLMPLGQAAPCNSPAAFSAAVLAQTV